MNLRASLSETIELLDSHPEIEVKKSSSSLISSLQAFQQEFGRAVRAKDENKKWEKLRGDLVTLSGERLGAEVREMEEKDLASFSKFFGIKPSKATKKLTARENAEGKLIKKIKEIGKQLH